MDCEKDTTASKGPLNSSAVDEGAASIHGENQEEGESEMRNTPLTISGQLGEKTSLFHKIHKKGFCAFLFVAFVAFLIVDSLSLCILPDALSGFLEWIEHNPVPGIFSFTVVFFIATIFLIPGALLTLGAGYVFANSFGMGVGVLLGTLSTFLGACAGSIASFLLGRYLLRDWVNKLSEKYEIFEALDAALNEKGLRIMVLLRLSPVIPFNVINYAAGVTGITFWEYTISLLALLPGTVLYVFLGASAGSLADSGNSGESSTVTTIVIVISVVLGILAIGLTSYYAKKELNQIADKKRSIAQHPECVTELMITDAFSGMITLESVTTIDERENDEEEEKTEEC
jgi:uncharacterized membrane protein YdjX (TVP38/TMEM64 family)